MAALATTQRPVHEQVAHAVVGVQRAAPDFTAPALWADERHGRFRAPARLWPCRRQTAMRQALRSETWLSSHPLRDGRVSAAWRVAPRRLFLGVGCRGGRCFG